MESGGNAASASGAVQAPSLSDVLAAVGSLADLMSSHGLTRLDLNLGSVAIRLRSDGNDEAPKQQLAVVETEALDAVEAPAAEGHFITAPMIGTYYAASAPSDPPFIQPGDWIEVGQVIGIIEAMKIMNEIVADRTGVVREILVQNAQAVEYGSPLVRIAE